MGGGKMKFKVKNPYRTVELIAQKHIDDIMELKEKDEIWSMLDHFFWETFNTIITDKPKKKIDIDELDRGIK